METHELIEKIANLCLGSETESVVMALLTLLVRVVAEMLDCTEEEAVNIIINNIVYHPAQGEMTQ